MKAALKTIPVVLVFLSLSMGAWSQDSNFARQQALKYADSLNNAFRFNNLTTYISMSYPGLVTYYGGKHQFLDYISRERNNGSVQENIGLELIQLENLAQEWQCVVKKTCSATIGGKPATISTYMVGQSKDGGHTWRYVDIASNPARNIVYIMPDVFEQLNIPQRQVIF